MSIKFVNDEQVNCHFGDFPKCFECPLSLLCIGQQIRAIQRWECSVCGKPLVVEADISNLGYERGMSDWRHIWASHFIWHLSFSEVSDFDESLRVACIYSYAPKTMTLSNGCPHCKRLPLIEKELPCDCSQR